MVNMADIGAVVSNIELHGKCKNILRFADPEASITHWSPFDETRFHITTTNALFQHGPYLSNDPRRGISTSPSGCECLSFHAAPFELNLDSILCKGELDSASSVDSTLYPAYCEDLLTADSTPQTTCEIQFKDDGLEPCSNIHANLSFFPESNDRVTMSSHTAPGSLTQEETFTPLPEKRKKPKAIELKNPSLRTASRKSKNKGKRNKGTRYLGLLEQKEVESSQLIHERECHNKVEKNYRERLNRHYLKLLDTLPPDLYSNNSGCRNEGKHGRTLGSLGSLGDEKGIKLSKGEVLEMATRYIKDLEKKNDILQQQNNRLSHGQTHL